MPKNISIAIIGGGASGVSLFVQLVDALCLSDIAYRIRIYFIEKEKNLGEGLAYSTRSDNLILNMRSNTMGIRAGEENGFQSWIDNKDENSGIKSIEYHPRELMGEYLQDMFLEAVQSAVKHNISVCIVKDEVIDIIERCKKQKIILKESSSIQVDYVNLCVGHLPSKDSKNNDFGNTYISSPYPEEALLERVDNVGSVGIIGTRLTAIDTAITLIESGFKGQLALFSRHGWLPCVQGLAESYQNYYVTLDCLRRLTDKGKNKLSLRKAICLIRDEIEWATHGKACFETMLERLNKGALDWMTSEIVASTNKVRRWQVVLNASSEYIDRMWNYLLQDDKRFFLENYYSLWMVIRHSMPIPNAEKILSYLKSGQLHVFSGDDRNCVSKTPQGYELLLQDDQNKSVRLSVDCMVNAKGPGRTIYGTKQTLLISLLKKGCLTENPLGGVSVEFDTLHPIGKNGRVESFYVIGALTCGDYFYTNALTQNAKQAACVVKQIIHRISELSYQESLVDALAVF